MCFIASTYSFSLSVNSFLADKEKIVSIESLSWREVAKTWPMTEKKTNHTLIIIINKEIILNDLYSFS